MIQEGSPSERTVCEALQTFMSPEFREFADPHASESELAEDAAAFAALDALGRGESAGMHTQPVAELVLKLAR